MLRSKLFVGRLSVNEAAISSLASMRFKSTRPASLESYTNLVSLMKAGPKPYDASSFQGKLYELTTQFLLKECAKTDLIVCGGNSDNGVDLRGTWNPSMIPEFLMAANKKRKKKATKTLDILVQCKSGKRLSGICERVLEAYGKNVQKGSEAVMFVVSPVKPSKERLEMFEKICKEIPLVYLQIARMNTMFNENRGYYTLRGFPKGKVCLDVFTTKLADKILQQHGIEIKNLAKHPFTDYKRLKAMVVKE